MTSEDIQLQNQGRLIDEFLNTTASQMTETGFKKLQTDLEDGKLCVFFRNNHFSTLLKRQGEIYLLATDLGFREVKSAVWEHLADISGNNKYFNSEFTFLESQSTIQLYASNSERGAIADFNAANELSDRLKENLEDESASLALAVALQEEENERIFKIKQDNDKLKAEEIKTSHENIAAIEDKKKSEEIRKTELELKRIQEIPKTTNENSKSHDVKNIQSVSQPPAETPKKKKSRACVLY